MCDLAELAEEVRVLRGENASIRAENERLRVVLRRVRALADEWQAELDAGLIRSSDARYCWGIAVREVRLAIKGDQ